MYLHGPSLDVSGLDMCASVIDSTSIKCDCVLGDTKMILFMERSRNGGRRRRGVAHGLNFKISSFRYPATSTRLSTRSTYPFAAHARRSRYRSTRSRRRSPVFKLRWLVFSVRAKTLSILFCSGFSRGAELFYRILARVSSVAEVTVNGAER